VTKVEIIVTTDRGHETVGVSSDSPYVLPLLFAAAKAVIVDHAGELPAVKAAVGVLIDFFNAVDIAGSPDVAGEAARA